MTVQQGLVYAVILMTLVLPMLRRWRYDLVALLGLLLLSLLQIIPQSEAFSGFGHPAVITVAAVLVVSRGLQNGCIVLSFLSRKE